MPTYPLATLGPTLNSSGISAPQYVDIYQSLIATFQTIYGSDIYVAADSQDGQFLAAIAQAIHDTNQAMIAVYQSFSPSYSQGVGLSNLVKINGIARLVSTHSTAVGSVVGVVGTIITNGVVKDANGKLWNLPASVTIPIAGSITVTVTAQDSGAVIAPTGTINQIYNPQLGWQSFSNTSDAVPGAPIESDAALRIRQALSTALPALAIKESISAAIANVTGVTRFKVYENDTGTTDANGIPAHTITAVVEGGNSTAIANAIYLKKPPGIQTAGTTSVVVTDPYGLQTTIHFDVLTAVPIYFAVTIKALTGYVSTTGDALKAALAAFINGLPIGEDVYASQAQAVASLQNSALGAQFYITVFKLDTVNPAVGTANIVIAYDAVAGCSVGNITLTVT